MDWLFMIHATFFLLSLSLSLFFGECNGGVGWGQRGFFGWIPNIHRRLNAWHLLSGGSEWRLPTPAAEVVRACFSKCDDVAWIAIACPSPLISSRRFDVNPFSWIYLSAGQCDSSELGIRPQKALKLAADWHGQLWHRWILTQHTHAHTRTHAHSHTHTHTLTLTHAHTHTYTHTRTHTHTHTHTYTHTHSLFLTHTLSFSHTLSLSHTHTHTLTHSHTLSLTHTHSHTLTHSHRYIHSHTYIHTHTLIHTWTLLTTDHLISSHSRESARSKHILPHSLTIP